MIKLAMMIMKSFYIVIFFVLLVNQAFSQQKLSTEKQIILVKRSIRNYLSETNKQYKHRDHEKWGNLIGIPNSFNDSFFLMRIDSCQNVIKSYESEIEKNQIDIKVNQEKFKNSTDEHKVVYDSLANLAIDKNIGLAKRKDSVITLCETIKTSLKDKLDSFIPDKMGYHIDYSFRTKDVRGTSVIHYYGFLLDHGFNIISTREYFK